MLRLPQDEGSFLQISEDSPVSSGLNHWNYDPIRRLLEGEPKDTRMVDQITYQAHDYLRYQIRFQKSPKSTRGTLSLCICKPWRTVPRVINVSKKSWYGTLPVLELSEVIQRRTISMST